MSYLCCGQADLRGDGATVPVCLVIPCGYVPVSLPGWQLPPLNEAALRCSQQLWWVQSTVGQVVVLEQLHSYGSFLRAGI